MTTLGMVRFLNDLSDRHGKDTRISELPMGVLSAERIREANGNGATGVASEGGFSAANAGPPYPSRYDNTPPRPQDLPSVEESDALMRQLERVGDAIGLLLSTLPDEDREMCVNGVLAGLRAARNG